jgi:hypothetical protein
MKKVVQKIIAIVGAAGNWLSLFRLWTTLWTIAPPGRERFVVNQELGGRTKNQKKFPLYNQ